MTRYLGLNRRTIGDRRVLDSGAEYEQRTGERRQSGSGRYVVVLGHAGIDRFELMVGLPIVLLIVAAVLSTFVRA